MLRLVLALALTGTASATDVITVSGGSFTAPYYTFDGVDKWPDGTPKLEEFKTYRFEDGGVSSGHPFRMTGSLDAAARLYHGFGSSAGSYKDLERSVGVVAVDVQPLAGAPAEGEPAGEEDEPPPALPLAASPAAGAQPQATSVAEADAFL